MAPENLQETVWLKPSPIHSPMTTRMSQLLPETSTVNPRSRLEIRKVFRIVHLHIF